MTTPAAPRVEQLLTLVMARLAQLQAGPSAWYTPGEIGRDWKSQDEVRSFPFYGVIEGTNRPAEGATHSGGTLLEQTVIVVIWVNEDKIAWGTEPKNRRTAIVRACADVVRALSAAWDPGVDWLIGVFAPSIVTDEAALVAKPYAYAEVTVTFRYWSELGAI